MYPNKWVITTNKDWKNGNIETYELYESMKKSLKKLTFLKC